jgi:phenylpyruvate tautomerase PptA (4-oxalocrotonate tautomerase family)
MPIVRVESSIPLPPQTPRAEALAAVAACIVRDLDVKPVQVRVAFVDIDPSAVMVAGQQDGPTAPPWIVAWASILEGRPEAQRAAFVADLLAVLARCYRVDESVVRVLVQDFPSVHWGIGRATATAKG